MLPRNLFYIISIVLPLSLCACSGNTSEGSEGEGASEARCPTPADCPCEGPSDCPDHWLCVIFVEGEGGYCLDVKGLECEEQSDCAGADARCLGLDCMDGRGAAGCGYGVCMDSSRANCSAQLGFEAQQQFCWLYWLRVLVGGR